MRRSRFGAALRAPKHGRGAVEGEDQVISSARVASLLALAVTVDPATAHGAVVAMVWKL